MPTFDRFEDIDAWQAARQLARAVYGITSEGAFRRDFGLRDQMRRSAVSAMSNIAEGFERDGNKEFRQFLSIAKGSCGEVRSQLYIAKDVGYLDDETYERLHEEATRVSELISGLMRYLRRSNHRGPKFTTPRK